MGDLRPLPRPTRTDQLRAQFEAWLADHGATIETAREPYRIACWFWFRGGRLEEGATLEIETARPDRRRA